MKVGLAAWHYPHRDVIENIRFFAHKGIDVISFNGNIRSIAKALIQYGYDGIVTIESAPGFQFPCYNREADEGILKTLHYWKECLEKAEK